MKDSFILQNVQTGSTPIKASYSIGARVVYRQRSSRSIKLNTYLHIFLSLLMSGALTLFPLHAFIGWTEKTLVFPFLVLT